MKQCKTCIDIADWQNVIDTERSSEFTYKVVGSIKIVGWLKSQPKKSYKFKCSEITGKKYLMKYCPTCGKKLDKRYLKKLLEEVGQ